MAIDKMHKTMTFTHEVFENQHQQQKPEATNPNMPQQQQKNPNLTQHNPQSPTKTLELDPERPPNSDPDGQIGVDPDDDDVEMISSDVKFLNQGEERRDFEGEGFAKEVVGGVAENFVDFEAKRMGEENGRFCFDGKNFVGGSDMFLTRCNGFDGDGVECVDFEEDKVIEEVEDGEEERGGEEEEDGEEEEEEEGEFSLAMEGETSNNLFQGIEAMQVPFSSLFGSMVENNSIKANSSQFVNGHDDNVVLRSNKRMVGGDDTEILYGNKRMRTEGLDFNMMGGGLDFDMCMQQMQHCMGKARVMYMEKEQACAESSMNQQFLLNELQKRQTESQQLQATIECMQQKRQKDVYRYEHEVHLMVNLIKGYREALKDTQKQFDEYRKRVHCAQLNEDEPLYKDVGGDGGLVLSVTKKEKQGLKEEEEERKNRLLVEKIVKDFEAECVPKFEAHRCAVESLHNRLLDVENQIEPIRELIAKRRVLKSSECDPSQ